MATNILSEWVYVEQDSRYPIPARTVAGGKIALLGELVRAVGTLSGVVSGADSLTIDGREYPAELARGGTLPAAGECIRFSFWPTLPAMPSARIRKAPQLDVLRISRISRATNAACPFGEVGRVEIVGKLVRVFTDGALVEVPAKCGTSYYVAVHGQAYEDELGRWLCITARFDVGKVLLVDSVPVAWVDYYRQGQPPEQPPAYRPGRRTVARQSSDAATFAPAG